MDIGKILQPLGEALPGAAVGDLDMAPSVERRIDHKHVCGAVARIQTGKYHALILCDDGQANPEPVKSLEAENITGLDMGLSHLVIASTGEKQSNPRFVQRAAANVRRKQKSLSRKKKGSANRNKARVLVAKAHERTANTRNDFQHKLSRRLIDESQAICVETLKVKNMLENPKACQAYC